MGDETRQKEEGSMEASESRFATQGKGTNTAKREKREKRS